MSKEKCKKNKCSIGGQAVLEGVMMRGATSMATAVRDGDGIVRLDAKRVKSVKKKNILFRLPVFRGAVGFFSSMVTGVSILLRSAEVFGGDEPTKFDKWLAKKFKIDVMQVVLFLGVALGLGLSILLFVMAPQGITELIASPTNISKTTIAFNFIEGGIRIAIFVVYILATSLLKDIKRTYKYHGAEHKTISCYESGLPLTIENVRKSKRVHDRCGTTFMFFVMLVSILVFSVANSFLQATGILRILAKIALLPVVAGLSYELLKGLSKTDLFIFYPIKLPGLLLQRITTLEPDDAMIEVAIIAFNKVLERDADETVPECSFVVSKKICDLKTDISKILAEAGITDESDTEWIISIALGIKRSDIEGNLNYVSPKYVEKAFGYANQRAMHKPLWYVIGDTEFYGLTITVDERVLIPRPETEELVNNAIKIIKYGDNVLDLCTGSGAVAIAVKKNSHCTVDALDISESALELAKKNAKACGADIHFIHSDLFDKVEKKYNVIVSNPPYIKSEDMKSLEPELAFEPIIALEAGLSGLEFYERIAADVKKYLTANGVLIMECGYDQANDIKKLLVGFDVSIIKDLNGIERIVIAVAND